MQPDCPEAVANLGVLALVKKQPQFEKGIGLLRKSLEHGDRKEIVQNLVTAVNYAPPQMQKNNAVIKEATEAARLLASRYDISGPQQAFYIIPLRSHDSEMAKAGKHGPGDKSKGKDDDDDDLHGATGMWSGSGFIISDDGLILTNRHVVDGGKTLLVLLSDKTQKSAEVVVIDDTQDLALIRIKADAKLPYVKLASADSRPTAPSAR